jgi:NAD(P)-dependent dehydrogenase (short-subunit alcohol dehydrogenase family)
MSNTIIVTGASSGFGAMTVRELADRLAELAPADADPHQVAVRIGEVVDNPAGQRTFRIHIDPANDGAEQVNDLGDRVRDEFYHRIGLADLLTVTRQH